MKMKKAKCCRRLGAIAVLGIAVSVAAKPATRQLQWKGMPLERSTTFITGPLYPDGSVDYIAAYNMMVGKGVTAKNNAALGLIRAFGNTRHVLGRHWKQILTALHLPLHGLPKHGVISYGRWLAAHRKGPRKPFGVSTWGHRWSAKKRPRLAEYITAMAPYLREIRRAVKLPRYYLPMANPRREHRFINGKIKSLPAFDHAGGALTRQAMLELAAGNIRACRRNIIADYRLAALLSQRTGIIESLVAMHITALGCAAQAALAKELCRRRPRTSWKKWKIAQPHLSPVWFAIYTEDRFMALDTAFAVFERGPHVLGLFASHTARIHPRDKTWVFQQINFQFNRIARLARVRNFKQLQKQLLILKNLTRHRSKLKSANPGSPDIIYHAIVSPLRNTLPPILRWNLQSRAARRVARIALALAMYHARHKVFPKSLKRLQGKFMRTVPRDPFTGKMFVYTHSPAGCVLQSVGPGGKYKSTWRWKQDNGMGVRLPN